MDLSSIQVDLAQVIGIIVATAVAALSKQAYTFFARGIGSESLKTLTDAAPHAVHAAEELSLQLAKANDSISSDEKLAFATARLVDLAKLGHIKLSEDQARVIIEGTLNQVRPYMEPPDIEPPPFPPKALRADDDTGSFPRVPANG